MNDLLRLQYLRVLDLYEIKKTSKDLEEFSYREVFHFPVASFFLSLPFFVGMEKFEGSCLPKARLCQTKKQSKEDGRCSEHSKCRNAQRKSKL